MDEIRKIRKIFSSQPALEGAGVHLKRAFGHSETPLFDPFLMLDDFRSANPDYFKPGFPWHPHRGIETVSYVIKGDIEHRDSLGNRGVIGSGDVQWMTAGSGIIHQEMPQGDPEGVMQGFQLWVNLPAAQKMRDPRYQEVKAGEIPVVRLESGVVIRVICGHVNGREGPVRGIVSDPEYLDVSVPPHASFEHQVKPGHTVLAYVIEGLGRFDVSEALVGNENVILFSDGEKVVVSTADEPVRFLLLSGSPIGERIAWRGPVVMNTEEELQLAFRELEAGTFIKHRAA